MSELHPIALQVNELSIRLSNAERRFFEEEARSSELAREVRELEEKLAKAKTDIEEWQKLGAEVRIAACGPNHSMGNRFEELRSIVRQRDEAVTALEEVSVSVCWPLWEFAKKALQSIGFVPRKT